MRLILISLIAATLAAAEAQAPTISDALRAQYWRAQYARAQAELMINATVEEMRKACGTAKLEFQNGEPACVSPPEK